MSRFGRRSPEIFFVCIRGCIPPIYALIRDAWLHLTMKAPIREALREIDRSLDIVRYRIDQARTEANGEPAVHTVLSAVESDACKIERLAGCIAIEPSLTGSQQLDALNIVYQDAAALEQDTRS